jgi:Stress responsive A/B Barrel Domain
MALRHIVLFGFADHVDARAKSEVAARFAALRHAVPGVEALEWGVNLSPEGLSHGHSHAFLLTFASDAARDAYLIHPQHVAFSDWVKPMLASVTVVDYWIVRAANPGSATSGDRG